MKSESERALFFFFFSQLKISLSLSLFLSLKNLSKTLQAGIHVITPNKKLNSGPLEQYSALRQFQRESYIHYLYEVRSFFESFF